MEKKNVAASDQYWDADKMLRVISYSDWWSLKCKMDFGQLQVNPFKSTLDPSLS